MISEMTLKSMLLERETIQKILTCLKKGTSIDCSFVTVAAKLECLFMQYCYSKSRQKV
jgi:hypothetical protein